MMSSDISNYEIVNHLRLLESRYSVIDICTTLSMWYTIETTRSISKISYKMKNNIEHVRYYLISTYK